MNETKKYKLELTKEELIDLSLACLEQTNYYTKKANKPEKKEESETCLLIAKDYKNLMKKLNDLLDKIKD